MSDQENMNINEEEYEEENLNLMNNPNENDNPEEDEGQDVYAFDIKVGQESYLLVIGKTEENKILLRLGDKVDQTKPFFQNEFSLEDLRKINPIFNNIDEEDIAFNYLASNLSDAEKEIKIIEDEKIKFIIYITDEDERIELDFILIKYLEENMENENEEDMMEEGVEIMNDLIDNNNENNNEEHQMENQVNEIKLQKEEVEIAPKEEKKEANLPLQIEEKKEIKETKEVQKINNDIIPQKIDINANTEISNPKLEQDMNLMKQELLQTINSLNENFNNQLLKQSEAFNKMKDDLIKENEIKINQMKEELNSKDNLISELQNKIGNLEQKLNDMNNKFDNININNINKENNNNNEINNEIINENNEKIMNEIKGIDMKINGIKDQFENDKNNQDSNIQILNEKIINLENDIQTNLSNKDNGDNLKILALEKIKGIDMKINGIKDQFENDKNNQDSNIQILNEKIINLENDIQTNLSNKDNGDNLKILALENDLKNLETKINEYGFDQLIENIALITEKQNDTKIYDIINNLENQIKEIKERANKSNRDSFSKNKNNNIDPEIINKINNYESIISMLQTQIKKIQEDKKSELNSKNKLDMTISDIYNSIKDLNTKTDSLANITKKLETENNDLNTKTKNLMANVSKISSISTQYNNTNQNYPSLSGNTQQKKVSKNYYHTMENQNQLLKNQAGFYNRTNPNMLTDPKNYFNSKIANYDDIIFLLDRLKDIHPKIKDVSFTLVYRASEDGDRAADFHQKCDKIGPNVVLIKTKRGNIFGGFTLKNWEHMPRDIDVNRPNLGSASRDSKAFGFSVNNQKIYNNERPTEFAIWCNRNYGPTFKNNLFQIFDCCMKKGGYCSIRSNSHFGGQQYDYEISGGESRFRVEDLEVFEVKFH